MPDIFNSRPGSVLQVALDGVANVLPFRLDLQGWDGFPTQKAIITSIGLHQTGNFQFLHTLRNFIYVYVFGEKIADLVLNGICFLNPCSPSQNADTTGFEKVFQYYQANRIAARESPVKIVLGTVINLEGFLLDVDIQANNASDMIAQFSLKFAYLPDQGL